jgi:hypothetical protein
MHIFLSIRLECRFIQLSTTTASSHSWAAAELVEMAFFDAAYLFFDPRVKSLNFRVSRAFPERGAHKLKLQRPTILSRDPRWASS